MMKERLLAVAIPASQIMELLYRYARRIDNGAPLPDDVHMARAAFDPLTNQLIVILESHKFDPVISEGVEIPRIDVKFE